MIHIATTNSNIPLIVFNLFESIRKNCSQDFVFHVCNSEKGCDLNDFAFKNKEVKLYNHFPDSTHSAVRHSEALNYLQKVLPQNEPVIICDADIYLCKNFDVLLSNLYDQKTFVATENTRCFKLPHPTLFYGKMETLSRKNIDFTAVPMPKPNGELAVKRETETGHRLGRIKGWCRLTQKPHTAFLRKTTFSIVSSDEKLIGLHFKGGRKFNDSPHFIEWSKYCHSCDL